MAELGGNESPVNCQPPEMREPAPAGSQSIPFVENSKVVNRASVVVPPRNQVMVELSSAIFSEGGSLLSSRPRLLRGCAASDPKYPPTKILPSFWTASV